MEKLKRLADQARRRAPPATTEEIFNLAREYLQLLILKSVFQSKPGGALSFMGGSCLRICYDLKRYSEDLDFAMDDPKIPYRFPELVDTVARELKLRGFSLAVNLDEDKIVQKVFFKFSGLPEALQMAQIRKEQKLHVKLEADTRPIPLGPDDRESFFVTRFDEIFPILKHDLPTLFAGKILAVLGRPYFRGRDYYDLAWYLSRNTGVNLAYVNGGLKEARFKDEPELFEAVRAKVAGVDPKLIVADVGRFLEDPTETTWLSRYPEFFEKLLERRRG